MPLLTEARRKFQGSLAMAFFDDLFPDFIMKDLRIRGDHGWGTAILGRFSMHKRGIFHCYLVVTGPCESEKEEPRGKQRRGFRNCSPSRYRVLNSTISSHITIQETVLKHLNLRNPNGIESADRCPKQQKTPTPSEVSQQEPTGSSAEPRDGEVVPRSEVGTHQRRDRKQRLLQAPRPLRRRPSLRVSVWPGDDGRPGRRKLLGCGAGWAVNVLASCSADCRVFN
jgi:hypothetical protein